MQETKSRPTPVSVQEERVERQERYRASVRQVDELARKHQVVGQKLGEDMRSLTERGHALEALEVEDQQTGLISELMRRLSRRSAMLERRSATEGLLAQYEVVDVRVREASAFCDELGLCARQLQADVDQLHQDLADSRQGQRTSARRVIDLENELRALRKDESLSPEELARREDALSFELKSSSISMDLHRARERLCRTHLDPTRELRDLVQRLHEEMAQFVLSAAATTEEAGRRIQALGMVADAPAVVAELSQSLSDLETATKDTTRYIEATQQLITSVLPELSARLEAHVETDQLVLTATLEDVNVDLARAEAEKALRNAAEDEVEEFLRK